MTDQESLLSWPVEIAAGLREVDSNPSAVTHREINLGGMMAEWDGGFEGEEFFVQVFYGSPENAFCEVRLDGWIFEAVRLEDVRELLATFFGGDVALHKSLLGAWTLTASGPDVSHTNSGRDRGPVPSSEWERRAIARGKRKR
ncbi:hypothetical protein [Streptomyces sp. NPDC021224]|uniref:hypothetical protein n=1 Tax=unclassified Streptomyces TaxID=2593676 RepID=UPI0037B65C5A